MHLNCAQKPTFDFDKQTTMQKSHASDKNVTPALRAKATAQSRIHTGILPCESVTSWKLVHFLETGIYK